MDNKEIDDKKIDYDSETSYIYMFVRTDLSIEQQIIQTAHAAHLIGLHQPDRSIVPHAVLIGMKNEGHLTKLANMLYNSDIRFEMFFEPDIDQYTALVTFPLKGKERELFSKFQTLKYDVQTYS